MGKTVTAKSRARKKSGTPSKANPSKANPAKANSAKANSAKASSAKTRATRSAKRGLSPTPAGSRPAAADGEPRGDSAGGHRWTFLTNHAHVLAVLHADPDLVLREVAVRVRITERAVQRIVQDLEEEGFIVRHRVGRQNRYEVLTEKSLRHPIESHRRIGDLLGLIS